MDTKQRSTAGIYKLYQSSCEETTNALKQSDELLSVTLSGDCDRVVHQKNTAVIANNNELSLSVTLVLAYYSAKNRYEIFRELPSGKGYADLTFIPRKGVEAPAMVLSLNITRQRIMPLSR